MNPPRMRSAACICSPEIRENLVERGQSGPESAKYVAEDWLISIPNFLRDSCTYAFWDTSCVGVGNQAKAALGSYGLTGRISHFDAGARTAVITFSGSNQTTLGSAFGITDKQRNDLNNFANASGYGLEIDQHFEWSEVMHW